MIINTHQRFMGALPFNVLLGRIRSLTVLFIALHGGVISGKSLFNTLL